MNVDRSWYDTDGNTEVLGEKSVPVTLWLLQIALRLARDRTWAFAVRERFEVSLLHEYKASFFLGN